jgi:8-oxo-dGTP pyrophosphatase MutT (NUDIX family)
MTPDFEQRLRASLTLELPYVARPLAEKVLASFRRARPAAVFILFSPAPCRLLFILRSATVESHAGQIAFPGGMIDPGDASPLDAALRELEEELGVTRECVEPLGALPELLTVTGFRVIPFVGKLLLEPERLEFRPNADEIAEHFWLDLEALQKPGVFRMEAVARGPVRLQTPVFELEGRRVWGATGAMVRNLLDRLAKVG